MNYVKCNLCGQDDWQVRLPATISANGSPDVRAFRCTSADYGQHPQIVQCRRCGYVYANPHWPADKLLDAYGSVEDEIYVTERQGRLLTFRKHLKALEKHTGPGQGRRLLDVGAYIGVFVEVARAAGWDACGVEPSEWAVQEAQARGLPMIHGTQHAAELAGQVFDVITLWDVIEHLADPSGELTHAHQMLKPGGMIAIHTMDIDSLAARLMGARWPWLMEMHIHYFSRKTLAKMLQKCGYEVIWSGPEGRYLRLGYLASRVSGLNPTIGKWADSLVRRLNLTELPVPVNFGDLFTVYARKPLT